MTRTEFKETAEEVFAELLPKVKAADRTEAINELINELQDRGLEIDDDEDEDLDEDSGDEEELEF
jgi:hypothetical protein